MHRLGSDKLGYRLLDEHLKRHPMPNNILQFRAVCKHIPPERVLAEAGRMQTIVAANNPN